MSRPHDLKRISDGGVVYHLNNPKTRHALKPWCGVWGWQTKVWREDDGLGADLCGH